MRGINYFLGNNLKDINGVEYRNGIRVHLPVSPIYFHLLSNTIQADSLKAQLNTFKQLKEQNDAKNRQFFQSN